MTAADTPRASSERDLVLFDGVCRSCHAVVNFVIRHDPRGLFCFVSQQSPLGQRLLAEHGLGQVAGESIVLIEQGRAFSRSTAVLRILGRLDGPAGWLGLLGWVPRVLRDPLYNLYARHRYRLFGRTAECLVPTPEIRARFPDDA